MKSRTHSRSSSYIELRALPIALVCGLLLFFASSIPRLTAGPTLPAPSTTTFSLNRTNQAVADLGMGGHSITNVANVQTTNLNVQVIVGPATNQFGATSLQKSANLSDLLSITTARANLNAGEVPVFDIPLGGAFTDFVLKASRVNYGLSSTLVFWYVSSDPTKMTFPTQVWVNGTQPWVYYTDSANTDSRVWLKQSATLSIYQEVQNRDSVHPGTVSGAVVVLSTINSDVSDINGDLVWDYCRCTSSAMEEDSQSRVLWHPITPKWIFKPLNPNQSNY